MPVLKAV